MIRGFWDGIKWPLVLVYLLMSFAMFFVALPIVMYGTSYTIDQTEDISREARFVIGFLPTWIAIHGLVLHMIAIWYITARRMFKTTIKKAEG